jgi:hypothetical protein
MHGSGSQHSRIAAAGSLIVIPNTTGFDEQDVSGRRTRPIALRLI